MNDNLYLIMTNRSLLKLADDIISSTDRIDNGIIIILEYNPKTKWYSIKTTENKNYKIFWNEKALFGYMDKNGYRFIGDENPLGAIFKSYTMAYLECIRWAANVDWTLRAYSNLLKE